MASSVRRSSSWTWRRVVHADRERAAQLVVPGDRDRHRGQQLPAGGVLELAAEQLVVRADERLTGLQHTPGGALSAVDAEPDPALRDVEARGGDGVASVLVDEKDAGHVRVQRERGFLHEGVEDLLQVQGTAERAGGADDGAVLQRACRTALVGFEAGVAGRGLVGEQLGELDLLGREVTAGAPAEEQDLADAAAPGDRDEQDRGDAVVRGAPGHDRVAGQRIRDRERDPGLQDAGGAGGTVFEAHVLARALAPVAGAAAVLADLQQTHVIGAHEGLEGGVERSPQRPWRARRGGLMRDAREWARHVASDVRCGAQGLCLPWIGVIGRSHRNLMVTYPPTTGD